MRRRIPAGAFGRARPLRFLAFGFALVVLGLLVRRDDYYVYLLVQIFLYTLLALSVILAIGYSGQLILCQGAFWGMGTYGFALLVKAGVPGWLAIVPAVALTGALGLLIALPALRTRGIYLGIVTLAFGIVFQLWVINADSLTGGTAGMYIDRLPAVLGLSFQSELGYYWLALAAMIGCLIACDFLLQSRVGIAFQCLKQNETAARALGVNAGRYRLLVFVVAACLGGVAGALFAPFNGYASPSLFGFDSTLAIILSGVLGGLYRIWGAPLGAALLVVLPETLSGLAGYRVTVYGLVLMLILLFLPNGLSSLAETLWGSLRARGRARAAGGGA